LDQRVEIVERRERFERDPQTFRADAEAEQHRLRQRLVRARKMLPRVKMDRALLRRVAELCLHLQVDGHRGELTIARASRALAAFEGRGTVGTGDVKRVALMSLRHRLRRDPLERIDSGIRIEQALETLFPPGEPAANRIATIW